MKLFRSPVLASLALILFLFTSCEKTIESISNNPNRTEVIEMSYTVANSDLLALDRLMDSFDDYPNVAKYTLYTDWVATEGYNQLTPSNGSDLLTNSVDDNWQVLINSGNLTIQQIHILQNFRDNMNNGKSIFTSLNLLRSGINNINGSTFQISILNTFADGMELLNTTNPSLFPQADANGKNGISTSALISPCADAAIGLACSYIGLLCSAATIVGAGASLVGLVFCAAAVDENC